MLYLTVPKSALLYSSVHTSVTDKPVHLLRLCLLLNTLDSKYVTSKAMVCLFCYFLIGTHLTLITYSKKKEQVLDKEGRLP